MKNPIFIFSLLGASICGARTIDVSEFGVVPGKDVSFALNQLVLSVKGEAGVTLVFPKGQYEFHPENAVEAYRAVANHDNSLKRMAFPLFGCENITVDGGGSLFMFHGRMSPFVLEGVKGAVLKNFSIDWSRSFHEEMVVVESDAKTRDFVVSIDPEQYPYTIQGGALLADHYDWQDSIGSNIVFDPKTRAPIFHTRDYNINPMKKLKVSAAGKNLVRFESASNKVAPPVGSVLVTYGTSPTNRLSPAIHLSSSKDVLIENVTIYDAGGMGLIAERTENVHLNHMVVTSTKERFVSTRADASHFLGCKGTIRLENCLFEHMLDDGINVHGAYVKVDQYLGDKQFICSISHFQQVGLIFGERGDKVAMISRETLLPLFEATIEEFSILSQDRMVITLSDVPEALPDGPLSMENLTWYPDVVMKKNIFRENRARSALITTKGKVLIENNYFSSQMNGILIEGDNNKWYESGAVGDVTIANNEFVNSGFEGGPTYPLYAAPLFTPEQRMGEGQYHRNINFVNNKVRSFNGHLAFACSVKGLNISGNTVEFSTDYPPGSEFPAIDLRYCDEVKIEGNKAVGFERPLGIIQSADCMKVEIEGNEGFSKP